MASQLNTELIKGICQRIDDFEQLPLEYQKACRVYCIDNFDDDDFLKHMANYHFLIAEVPVELIKQRIMESFAMNNDCEEFKSFADWAKWYQSYGDIPDHGDSRWACILSSFEDECFEDGWHRFQSYLIKGYETIPVIAWQRNDTVQ